MEEKKIEGDDKALTWRHMCITLSLTLNTSSPVHTNLTEMAKLDTEEIDFFLNYYIKFTIDPLT